jgi:hypothetical protein
LDLPKISHLLALRMLHRVKSRTKICGACETRHRNKPWKVQATQKSLCRKHDVGSSSGKSTNADMYLRQYRSCPRYLYLVRKIMRMYSGRWMSRSKTINVETAPISPKEDHSLSSSVSSRVQSWRISHSDNLMTDDLTHFEANPWRLVVRRSCSVNFCRMRIHYSTTTTTTGSSTKIHYLHHPQSR